MNVVVEKLVSVSVTVVVGSVIIDVTLVTVDVMGIVVVLIVLSLVKMNTFSDLLNMKIFNLR